MVLLILLVLVFGVWAKVLIPHHVTETALLKSTSLERRAMTTSTPVITEQIQVYFKNRTACGCGIGHFPSTTSYADCGFGNGDPFLRYTCMSGATCTDKSGFVYCSASTDPPDLLPNTVCVDFDHYNLTSTPCLTCGTTYCTSGYQGLCGTVDFGSSTLWYCATEGPYSISAFVTATSYTPSTSILPTSTFNFTSALDKKAEVEFQARENSSIGPETKKIIIIVAASVGGAIVLLLLCCCGCCLWKPKSATAQAKQPIPMQPVQAQWGQQPGNTYPQYHYQPQTPPYQQNHY